MNISPKFLIAGLAMTAVCFSVNAQLIANGSFEQGTFVGPSFTRLMSGSTSLTGWTIGGVAVDWHNTIEFHNPQHGSYAVDLNLDGGTVGRGTISQSFGTVIGDQYKLSFYLSGPGLEFGFQNPRTVSVGLGGNVQVFSVPASSHFNMIWALNEWAFTAATATTTLIFSSPIESVGFWGAVIDNVSVVPVGIIAVPEPSTYGFLGLAMLLALIGHRSIRDRVRTNSRTKS